MSLRRAQNIFMPKNINSITTNITLEGIERIKTEKNDEKTDVTNTGNGERGTGNGEPGTGVWEQVYSGNPLENSKWRSKQKKGKDLFPYLKVPLDVRCLGMK